MQAVPQVLLVAAADVREELLQLRVCDEGQQLHWLSPLSNGVEAIRYLLRVDQAGRIDSQPAPDVILLDLALPTMNGLQVLRVLHSTRFSHDIPLPPVVVLASEDQDHDVTEAFRLGAYSVLTKPIEKDRCLEIVHQTLSCWKARNPPLDHLISAAFPFLDDLKTGNLLRGNTMRLVSHHLAPHPEPPR